MFYKGDIWYADFEEGIGSEQSGKRPVLIIQNNIGNKNSPTVIVALITKHCKSMYIPTHVKLNKQNYSFLKYDSIVLTEQIRTIDKARLYEYKGCINSKQILEINEALRVSLNL